MMRNVGKGGRRKRVMDPQKWAQWISDTEINGLELPVQDIRRKTLTPVKIMAPICMNAARSVAMGNGTAHINGLTFRVRITLTPVI